jgi:hypothetical protein
VAGASTGDHEFEDLMTAEKEDTGMPKAIMVVYTEPSDPSREEEFRRWYDYHIGESLKAVDGMPRAVRYKLAENQGHPVDEAFRYMTVYEIETDDVDALHERLSKAWEDDELPKSDVVRPGPVVYWDVDSVITVR